MEQFLGTLAVAGPIIGIIIGMVAGALRKKIVAWAAKGYLYGSVALVPYAAWTVPQWRQHYQKYVRTPDSWKKDQPKDMRELIDADMAESAVTLAAGFITGLAALIGAVLKLLKHRLASVSAFITIASALTYLLWCAYNWHCRYDPVTDYFGLEKVRVLGVNFVMFLAAGVAMGVLWTVMTNKESLVRLSVGSLEQTNEPTSQLTN